MDIRYYEEEKRLIFKIQEEIDECSVKNLRRKADYEIERFMPREVVFDFNRVTFMDSAGIGMIIGRFKTSNLVGAKMYVVNLNEEIRKIFEMSGILKIIPEKNFDEEVINL